MSLDIASLFAEREAERFDLHTRYLNEQMVRVLKTIGFDVAFRSGRGQYLYDRAGTQYLDLLSGWGVFALGRNHPATAVVRSRLGELYQKTGQRAKANPTSGAKAAIMNARLN